MSAPRLDPKLKFALELGPLALFFLSYRGALYVWPSPPETALKISTAVMMVTALASLAISWTKLRRLPIMPVVTAAIVLIFGGLTLYLNNPTFIKMKPTVLYCLFALALFFGLATRRPMLQILFDGALHLSEAGWRILTWRWAFFFLVLAGLNEYVWRDFSESAWVTFKSFGFLPLTIVFALAQTPLILKHETKEEPAQEAL